MVNDEVLAEIEALCSQGVDLNIALLSMDLPASLVSDPQVRQVAEKGQAVCMVKLTSALQKSAERGNVTAATALLGRHEHVDTAPVEEKPFSFFDSPWPEGCHRYNDWLTAAIPAIQSGTDISIIESCRPALSQDDMDWFGRNIHGFLDIDLMLAAQGELMVVGDDGSISPRREKDNTKFNWFKNELEYFAVTKTAKRIDPDAVRKLAAMGFDQRVIAAKMDLSPRQLTFRLGNDPVLHRAWQAGVQEWKATKAKAPGPKRRGPKPKTSLIAEMDAKEKADIAIRVSQTLMAKALTGNIAACRYLLDRISPISRK